MRIAGRKPATLVHSVDLRYCPAHMSNTEAPLLRRIGVFLKSTVPHGLAFFFGTFSLLNLLGEFKSPGFDANLWWIDLRFWPDLSTKLILVGLSVVLIAFAVSPPISRWRQLITAGATLGVAVLALINTVQFYEELTKGRIHSSFPVPLSIFVCMAFLMISRFSFSRHSAILYSHHLAGVFCTFLLCVGMFPLLQVFCFGKTDYRRSADAIVVLGARAYASGKPSDALADRVRTACELYKEGLAPKLIFSGGPGDGAVHETEAMKR
jgi:hypothetical protein